MKTEVKTQKNEVKVITTKKIDLLKETKNNESQKLNSILLNDLEKFVQTTKGKILLLSNRDECNILKIELKSNDFIKTKDGKALISLINEKMNSFRIEALINKSKDLDEKKIEKMNKKRTDKAIYKDLLKGELNSIFSVIKAIKIVDKNEKTKRFPCIYKKSFHVALLSNFLNESQFIQVAKNSRLYSIEVAINCLEKLQTLYDLNNIALFNDAFDKGKDIDGLLLNVMNNETTIEVAFNCYLELKK